MTFKIIYTNGDSYASGDELGYSKYYPEMSGLTPFSMNIPVDPESAVLWGKLTVNNFDKYRLYLEECKRLAYTAKLGSILNIPSINLSRGGRSNQEAIALTIDYLENRLLKIYKPEEILVILGVTWFERYRVPYEKDVSGSTSLILGHPRGDATDLYQYYVMNHNDKFIISDVATHFIAGMLYLEKKGISVVLVDSQLFARSKQHMKDTYKDSLLNMIPDADVTMGLYAQPGEKCRHKLGHFSEVVHERTAEALSAVIKEKFKDKF